MTTVKTKTKTRAKTKTGALARAAFAQSASEQALYKATDVAAKAMLLKVADVETLGQAASLLVLLKSVEKFADEKVKAETQPLKNRIKEITAQYAPGFEILEKAEAHLRLQYSNFAAAERDRVEKLKAEEMKKAEAAARKGNTAQARDHALAAVSEQGPARVVTASADVAAISTLTHSQVAMRRPWVFEVMEVNDVPSEYWTVDEAKIRAAVKAGVRAIPGVRIFQADQLAVGGR
jgi:hypothetical protein